MSNYANLYKLINDNVYPNANHEIDAEMVKTVFGSIVANLGFGYQFLGVINPSSAITATDLKVFYIGGPGSYRQFGGTIDIPEGSLGIFAYADSWQYSVVSIVGLEPIESYISQEIERAVSNIQPIIVEGNVTNAPDEEFLTERTQGGTNVITLKDKEYSPLLNSGLGCMFLRKNIVNGRNILTQEMINKTNTIYHILYDYEINKDTSNHNVNFEYENKTIIDDVTYYYQSVILAAGDKLVLLDNENCVLLSDLNTVIDEDYFIATEDATIYVATSNNYGSYYDVYRIDTFITIPDNSVLLFDGGSLSNGIIFGNNSKIVYNGEPIFDLEEISGFSSLNLNMFKNITDNLIESVLNSVSEFDMNDITVTLNRTIKIDRNNESLSIKNGTFKASSIFANGSGEYIQIIDGCLLGINNTVGVNIHNVLFDGQRNCLFGLRIRECSNIQIDNCQFNNMDGKILSAGIGLFLNKCINGVVSNCSIDGIYATPNGTVGDAVGSATGIQIESSEQIAIENCNISNVISSEDGDGIVIQNFPEGGPGDIDNYPYSNITIRGLHCFNISRTCLKIQAAGVVVCDSYFNKENTAINTSADPIIRIYGKKVVITNNMLSNASAYSIVLGTNYLTAVSEIDITNNIFNYDGRSSYQGCIGINGCPVDNVQIVDNICTSKTNYESFVYVNSGITHTRISGNRTQHFRYFIRFNLESNYSFSDIEISNNVASTIDGFCQHSETQTAACTYSRTAINGNINYTSTLPGNQNVFNFSSYSTNFRNSITFGNNVSNGIFLYSHAGYDYAIPSLPSGRRMGFDFFRYQYGIPTWWNGERWVDANGKTPGYHVGDISKLPGFLTNNPAPSSDDNGYPFFLMDATYGTHLIFWRSNIATNGAWVDAAQNIVIQ